jgi:hypothetical protein
MDIHTDTLTDGRDLCVKFVVEMGSGAVIYILSFIKIGTSIQKLIGGIHRHTDSMEIA